MGALGRILLTAETGRQRKSPRSYHMPGRTSALKPIPTVNPMLTESDRAWIRFWPFRDARVTNVNADSDFGLRRIAEGPIPNGPMRRRSLASSSRRPRHGRSPRALLMRAPVSSASFVLAVHHRSARECPAPTNDADQKVARSYAENHLSATDPTSMPCPLPCNRSSAAASSSTSSSL